MARTVPGSLRGRAALVTGGTSPIGRAICEALADEGMRVAVHYRRSGPRARALARRIGGTAVAGDLPRDAESVVRRARAALGRLDLLVNNASHIEREGWTRRLDRLTDTIWRRTFEVDVLGAFRCARAAARTMRSGGSILFVGSTPALSGEPEGLPYAAAKAAVIGMSRSLAAALAPRIRVNCMALGSVETDWMRWLGASGRRAYRAAIPLRRFGRPADVAGLAVYLARAGWMTGQTLVLDGGEVRR